MFLTCTVCDLSIWICGILIYAGSERFHENPFNNYFKRRQVNISLFTLRDVRTYSYNLLLEFSQQDPDLKKSLGSISEAKTVSSINADINW